MQEPIELTSTIAPQECVVLEDNGHAVVDIPIDVVASMVLEVLNRDLLCASITENILHAAAESLGRRDTRSPLRMH